MNKINFLADVDIDDNSNKEDIYKNNTGQYFYNPNNNKKIRYFSYGKNNQNNVFNSQPLNRAKNNKIDTFFETNIDFIKNFNKMDMENRAINNNITNINQINGTASSFYNKNKNTNKNSNDNYNNNYQPVIINNNTLNQDNKILKNNIHNLKKRNNTAKNSKKNIDKEIKELEKLKNDYDKKFNENTLYK